MQNFSSVKRFSWIVGTQLLRPTNARAACIVHEVSFVASAISEPVYHFWYNCTYWLHVRLWLNIMKTYFNEDNIKYVFIVYHEITTPKLFSIKICIHDTLIGKSGNNIAVLITIINASIITVLIFWFYREWKVARKWVTSTVHRFSIKENVWACTGQRRL